MLWAGLLAGLLCAAAAVAQQEAPPPEEKPVLVYAGAPLRLPLSCPQADLEELGLACPEHNPCPALLELTAVEGVGARVFLTGNIHTGAVTLYSVLLASSDAGRSWSEPVARILNASLDQIQFLDYLNGWAAGQRVQPLPHDPFLLKTSDGGTIWRRYPVFAEKKSGLIEMFRFESPTRGTLWVDRVSGAAPGARYEQYETVTGGESWILRQAVPRRPAAAGPAPAAEPLWRIRAAGPPDVYLVERNDSGAWRTAASFYISLGVCKTPAAVLPAEPPAVGEPVAPGEERPAPAKKSGRR